MAITWDFDHGNGVDNPLDAVAMNAFFEALFYSAPSFATTSSFVMQTGTSKIVFAGKFEVTALFPPSVTSGTISGFKVYSDGVQMFQASGYGLDYHVLMDGLAAAPTDGVEGVFALTMPGPMTINGSDDADGIMGSEFADSIHAGGSADFVSSGGGDDFVWGGDGNDRLFGGDGNDWLVGGKGRDNLHGGAGVDTASYAEMTGYVAVALNGTDLATAFVGGVIEDYIDDVENLVGGSGNDVLQGDGRDNFFLGGLGDDHLRGASGNDRLSGEAGADKLVGDAGNDELSGGRGRDTLIGGPGSDRFVFDCAPGKKGGKANADKIADFASGFDRIVLDRDVFRKLKDDGRLKGKYFAEGGPEDANDYVVFRKGKLFYDKDGDGDAAMKLLAKLGDARLHADDILVG